MSSSKNVRTVYLRIHGIEERTRRVHIAFECTLEELRNVVKATLGDVSSHVITEVFFMCICPRSQSPCVSYELRTNDDVKTIHDNCVIVVHFCSQTPASVCRIVQQQAADNCVLNEVRELRRELNTILDATRPRGPGHKDAIYCKPGSSDKGERNDLLDRGAANALASSSEVPYAQTHAQNGVYGNVFPEHILSALQCDVGDDIADFHTSVTVLMADIVGFTAWCSETSPKIVIESLSAYFQVLDDLAENLGVYKVETIGDGYQAICGAPLENSRHAENMAQFALKIIDTVPHMREIFRCGDFNVRVGINSGPIVTGVIRADRPRWQLFGDTVNFASRMESTSIPGRIQVSRQTYNLLLVNGEFKLERRGLLEIKGKGSQETFFLNSFSDSSSIVAASTSARKQLLSDAVGDILTGRGLSDVRKKEGALTTQRANNSMHSQQKFKSTVPTSAAVVDVHTPWKEAEILPQQYHSEGSSLFQEDTPEKSVSVLLVDDMLSILLQYTRVLQKAGIPVTTARDGVEALATMKEQEFTVVFCDITMPNMDGLECVRQFREWEATMSVRKRRQIIYALTGNTDGDSLQQYLSTGFDATISKTNSKNVLLSYVHNAQAIIVNTAAKCAAQLALQRFSVDQK
eukprot:CAMPEP_0183789222 /NCGR_PEP_ID=MMETSP0803_2-20130417/292_1 /TAXON_ID=195967 /ORGANISM="Crustomastix stigmata, Strain CCMP3273" /LENGTH=633 /DNA_ID=CAMNT_0026033385 /DNA_START=266 /DNA_END=2167 /DNA_ORIENTATION=-